MTSMTITMGYILQHAIEPQITLTVHNFRAIFEKSNADENGDV